MINSEELKKIFLNCLFKKEEVINGKPIVDPVTVTGIQANFGFHPDRIKESEKDIIEMLKDLPAEFHQGWTFLNLFLDKDKEVWTDLQVNCEELMVLGMAINKVQYCFPKEMWKALPGGMPFIKVLNLEDDKTEV